MQLDEFLAQKPLFYDVIDYTRMPKAYASIQNYLKIPKIIHLVGTNGKGTTGRFLAQMLLVQGLHVGHYTSPHIERFNERIWCDGKNVADELLENAHQKLLLWLDQSYLDALSYFEYTTLLAMVVLGEVSDYIILEAGMGGEYDATNVFPKILSIVTPIGYDHQAFLGNTIEEIAQTKLNSVTTDCVLAKQYAHEVYALALQQSCKVDAKLFYAESFFDTKRNSAIEAIAKKQGLAPYLIDNFKTARCALSILGYDIDLEKLNLNVLEGRCQSLFENVTVDVGHNSMAAHALVKHFGTKKVILVYNSYADKDYSEILQILKPIVEEVQIIHVENPRIVSYEILKDTIVALGLKVSNFSHVKPGHEYLVFGSFSVVEMFLKGLREK